MPADPSVVFPIWEQRRFAASTDARVVIMPFGEAAFDDVFVKAIVPAIAAAGLTTARADRGPQPKVMEHIWSLLNQARVIVADISGRNPNVLYELGIAHTVGKPSIILRSDEASHVPFDVRHLRSIKYDPLHVDTLKSELQLALEGMMTAFPTGHRMLDELEDAVRRWRGPSRDFGLLYAPDRLADVQRQVPVEAMSDEAVAFCAASACQWGSAPHMVHWGKLCNGRPNAAIDLGFGIFNHQRRPRLRLAHLICQFEPPVRTAVLTKLAEHQLTGVIMDVLRSGDVAQYIRENQSRLELAPGEVAELEDLFRNTKLVFSRPMP